MSHTPEPWKSSKTYPKVVRADDGMPGTPIADCYNFPHAEADASHIVDCVNGCAGLNPAAYRACVTAIIRLTNEWPVDQNFACGYCHGKNGLHESGCEIVEAQQALAQAVQP